MFDRSLIAAIAIVVALCATTAEIRAWDDSKYPDLKGQWVRAPGGGARYDWSKPAGRGQEAPLTPEYQAIYEANLADMAKGGQLIAVFHPACRASCTSMHRWRSS